jgi:hypothetical protein
VFQVYNNLPVFDDIYCDIDTKKERRAFNTSTAFSDIETAEKAPRNLRDTASVGNPRDRALVSLEGTNQGLLELRGPRTWVWLDHRLLTEGGRGMKLGRTVGTRWRDANEVVGSCKGCC